MALSAIDLADRFQSKSVSFDVGQGGLTRCTIDNTYAQSVVYLQGAHVTHFQPSGERPVLWMSDQSRFESGQPIRGGIPICWPWFGPHPSDPDLPQHGFARISDWMVRSILESEETTTIIFGLSNSSNTSKLFKHSFDARYRVSVGRELTVELSVTNTGDQEMVDVGCALHSYFDVEDIGKINIGGLETVRFLDKLTGEECNEPESISIKEETDRVYHDSPACITLADEGFRREIKIRSEGSQSTIVWNPWIEKSNRMGDFPDQGFRKMVCIETANALDDVRNIKPGETHTISQTIQVVN